MLITIGKVEIYQQVLLDAMKQTLFNNLKRSVVRYAAMTRSEWLMHKKPPPNPVNSTNSKIKWTNVLL